MSETKSLPSHGPMPPCMEPDGGECCPQYHRLHQENMRQRAALKAVEEWWLSDGMKHFNGAPYAIFATRSVLADAE